MMWLSLSPRWTSLSSLARSRSLTTHRTSVKNPLEHKSEQEGRLYTLPPQEQLLGIDPVATKRASSNFGLFPHKFLVRSELFEECCVLVRNPALQIFKGVERHHWEKSKLNFVLYGKTGQGKTVSLGHVNHYFLTSEKIITIYMGTLKRWMHHYEEIAESTRTPDRFNHVTDSQTFLKQFLNDNKHKIDGLCARHSYKWSNRESTEEGSPLVEMVQIGIDRPNYAADIVSVLFKELILACQSNDCRIAVLVDDVNPLFGEMSLVNRDDSVCGRKILSRKRFERMLAPDQLTVMRALKKLLRNDYPNCVTVTTVERTAVMEDKLATKVRRIGYWWNELESKMEPNQRQYYPFALLGQEGWETLDPFVPIEVPPYNEGEMDAMIDYYLEKKYLKPYAGTDMGRREIHFLTGRNPKEFFLLSSMW